MPSATPPTSRDLKVLLLCTGVGIMNRGIESFFLEAYKGLHGTPGLDVHLLHGGPPDAVSGPGVDTANVHRTFVLPRTGRLAQTLGKALRRSPYTVEQLTAYPGAVRWIRTHRPDVVFYSDINIAMQLFKRRDRIGVPFRLVLSNGGPVPPPFTRTDAVQQVAPYYHDQALAAGENPARQVMVPYGIVVPDGPPPFDPARRAQLRARLGIPQDRPVVISVGWVAREHKRMHHAVQELASIPPDRRPFLVILGAIDKASPDIFDLARSLLREEDYLIRSVPGPEVNDYYAAADVFALCSLKEGFGRVYIEALMSGLPAIAHPHPVMKFVLGDEGTFVDMDAPGPLAAAIEHHLRSPLDPASMARRRESVRTRFSWTALAPAYRDLFRHAASLPLIGPSAPPHSRAP